MGYSTTNIALLTAIAGKHTENGTTPDNRLRNVTLSAHLNDSDTPGEFLNNRLGILHTMIGGSNADGAFLPERTLFFDPTVSNASLGKKSFGVASVRYGAYTSATFANKTLHFWVDQVAFVRFGDASITATVTSYACMPYTVYPFYTDQHSYLAVIRDTTDGNIYISLPE